MQCSQYEFTIVLSDSSLNEEFVINVTCYQMQCYVNISEPQPVSEQYLIEIKHGTTILKEINVTGM